MIFDNDNWDDFGINFTLSPKLISRLNGSDLNMLLELERIIGYLNGIQRMNANEHPDIRRKHIERTIEKDDETTGKNIRIDNSVTLRPNISPIEDVEYNLDKMAKYCLSEVKSPKENPDTFEKENNNAKDKDISSIEKPRETLNPFVFICNRLTFLIKTKYPIIWDTSSIAEPYDNCIFIALDKSKNPLIDMKEAAKLSIYINTNQEIQKEIKEFIDNNSTNWSGIVCSPYTMAYNGENRFGFIFTLISE